MKTQSRTLNWNDLQLRRNNSKKKQLPQCSYSYSISDSKDRISTTRTKSEMVLTLLNETLKNK